MEFNDYYEELTSDEADFIIDIYTAVDALVYHGYPVTIVGLAYQLDVTTTELADYLPIIVTILNKVEEEYAEVQQKPN